MILSEVELKNKLAVNGLKSLKCSVDTDGRAVNLIEVDIDGFIEYAKDNDYKYIFYSYLFLDRDDYLISKDEAEYKLEDAFKLVEKEITAHNKTIRKIDFTQPAEMILVCCNRDAYVVLAIKAGWLKSIESAESKLDFLNDKYFNEIKTFKEQAARNKEIENDRIESEIKELLINDKDFALCTNQTMRKNYMVKFVNKIGNENYKKFFTSEVGMYIGYKANATADSAWLMLKSKNL